ncbi:hypothetical protein HTV45_02415 [Streptomyces sp. CHD11]|uniref:hypothetical protein n=1 Tax=Streptomyces sp. CHD11 TaxID=2741325 RepID=UPI001BFCC818|nr:hypothetical protein [Streptomyces sp. CHD11]MBT3149776.1 hypothetical protein [Streptomyces sp. CHD11]
MSGTEETRRVRRGVRTSVLVLLLLCAAACRVGGDDSVGGEPEDEPATTRSPTVGAPPVTP